MIFTIISENGNTTLDIIIIVCVYTVFVLPDYDIRAIYPILLFIFSPCNFKRVFYNSFVGSVKIFVRIEKKKRKWFMQNKACTLKTFKN